MSLHDDIAKIGQQAKTASRAMTRLSTRKKNSILEAMAEELDKQREAIQEANELDLKAGRKNKLTSAMLDRLTLNDERIDGMIKSINDLVSLKDPVGEEISTWMRPNGLQIQKVHVPIGVIGIIYESRPNVTAEAATLCFKTSNAVVLRGGSEAIHSNQAIARALLAGGERKGMPEHAIQVLKTTDREAVKAMCNLEGVIDLIIPRGGESLIRAVMEMSKIPVIKHYKGVCHVFVDAECDTEMALAISENSKVQRPGVCNAMETLLVHEKIAAEFLPALVQRLEPHGVELRGDAIACTMDSSIKEATEQDWYEEYLDLTLAVRVVPGVREAIDHINHYGSGHSDAIVSSNEASQKLFTQEVDSAAVYVNASTRFTDGGEFGMGAEIGVSTDKLHARGPMGLEELTTYKYVILGEGQIRE